MLAVAPSRNIRDEREVEKIESFSIVGGDDFLNFSGDNLLESINFDDLFEGMEDEDHVLPALEMEPEILAEFSVSGGEESEMNKTSISGCCEKIDEKSRTNQEEEDKVSGSSCLINHSQGDESIVANPSANKGAGKGRKSSKNLQGKRKVKVDWTPDLHRRFVQAVEQLGVDKAVPSRILELMGIECLTRHNIASHLQKYRSHRKHLLAREAEAASWSQRRQLYGAAATGRGGGCKREMTMISPWLVPTVGFPPMAPIPPPHHFSRPLHVWGHPSMDQSLKHIWPKHLRSSSRSPPPTLAWPPAAAPPRHLPPPPSEPSFWHSRHQHVPNSPIPGTLCFPPPSLAVPTMTPQRYPAPTVPGIPPHAVYQVHPTAAAALPAGHTAPLPPFDFHPSTEIIDAAIGDVLSKPWLPLPLGLKPPSTDSVVVELHRQGIEKIPPPCA